jgi:KaiC/GvpD/RAD55 family RecA-like ATPase
MDNPLDTATGVLPLPFGIPALDHLLGLEHFNSPRDLFEQLQNKTSLTIVGEDGTGKSVFGFHIASAYQALTQSLWLPDRDDKNLTIGPELFPLVLYVSSDLPWAAAHKTWRDFYLDYPYLKYVPGASGLDLSFRRRLSHRLVTLKQDRKEPSAVDHISELRIPLKRLAVTNIAEFLHGYVSTTHGQPKRPHVGFLDLAAQTAGDDWLFIARILSSVQRRASKLPNLLILDSVAGFEALVGETNSFGERMSRRARLAQLVRAAGEHWNIVLISEEPDQQKHQQEEYITDTVVHLYRRLEQRAVRRSLEIEKSRAHSFATGRHVFEIRDGRGSSTGSWENPDDRRASVRKEVSAALESAIGGNGVFRPYSAHIEVFPSLEHLGSEFARRQQTAANNHVQEGDVEGFGIKNLDQMLESAVGVGGETRSGLRHGTVTSLVGDEGTRKVALAEQFLVASFAYLPALLGFAFERAKRFRMINRDTSTDPFLKWIASERNLKELDNKLKGHPGHACRCAERLRLQTPRYAQGEERADFYAVQTVDKTAGAGPGTLRLKPLKTKAGSPAGEGDLQLYNTRWDTAVYYEDGAPDTSREDESALIAAFTMLRTLSGLMVPAVMVCSHDTSADHLSRQIYQQYEAGFKRELESFCDQNEFNESYRDLIPAHIRHLIERFMVVRRLELEDASASKLWNIIETCASHGLNLFGHTLEDIHRATEPLSHAGLIRLVLTDWRSIRDTYPSIVDDPLFLPTVNFRLKRLGVTSLVVDSETGRPDEVVSDPLSRALRNTVGRHIYTWKVTFFGEQRIALTVLPPGNKLTAGVVRELRLEAETNSNRGGSVVVDRHFELYTGLQEGKAETVPLKVLLYGETRAFEHYAQSENDVLNRLFQGPGPNIDKVVETLGTSQYESLRDYCHLSINRRLPYTLVFVIDGFWGLGHNVALRDQNDYLFNELALRGSDDDDAFGHFKQTSGQHAAQAALEHTRVVESQSGNSVGDQPQPIPPSNRRGYFRNNLTPISKPMRLNKASTATSGKGAPPLRGYQCRLQTRRDKTTDRVPFTWDFGFLLCSKDAWRAAYEIPLQWNPRGTDIPTKVRDVWKRLQLRRHVPDGAKAQKQMAPVVGWREFLEATAKVAERARTVGAADARAFDVAVTSPESLSCLLLEIWLSEALKDCREIEEACKPSHGPLADAGRQWSVFWRTKLNGLSSPEYKSKEGQIGDVTFQEFLSLKPVRIPDEQHPDDADFKDGLKVKAYLAEPGLTLQLYKAWLLIVDVLPFEELFARPPGFALVQDRPASGHAVSSRHWYKTACAATGGELVGNMLPMALPGEFTTRGDWYLGVARGSRSDLLADQALDILCSRRANRTRLHLGLGLPTRDILEGNSSGAIRTAIAIRRGEVVDYVLYSELLNLGGTFVDENQQDYRRWLFRSGIRDYDRQTIAIRRWMQRLFWWTPRFRRSVGPDTWIPGFVIYDRICRGDTEVLSGLPSFTEFKKGLLDFSADLNNCTRPETTPITAL